MVFLNGFGILSKVAHFVINVMKFTSSNACEASGQARPILEQSEVVWRHGSCFLDTFGESRLNFVFVLLVVHLLHSHLLVIQASSLQLLTDISVLFYSSGSLRPNVKLGPTGAGGAAVPPTNGVSGFAPSKPAPPPPIV